MNRTLTILFLCLISTISCRTVGKTPSFNTLKLHFPQQWHKADERPMDSIEQIEVRTLSNSPGEYFFAALESVYNRVYSENSYAVKMTPNLQVRAATRSEWESARRIETSGRPTFPIGSDLSSGEIEYRGKKFQKTGKYWQSAWLSPAGKWLAAFSYTGEKKRDWFMDGGSVHSGDIFWDVYDTETGKKVFEWRATNVKNPTTFGGPVVWLEERYFLFPENEEDQDFILVTLPN